MSEFPHEYKVSASAGPGGDVIVGGSGLPDIPAGPPPQFGGTGGQWSPEDFITAAVASCFILSFRAVARGSRFEWFSMECHVNGILDRVEGVTRFIRFETRVVVTVPEGTDPEKAIRLLEKADKVCLITNSLTSESVLEAQVSFR